MIVSNSLIPYNGYALDYDYRYVDLTSVDGTRYFKFPEMPTLTRLKQRLRFLTLLASFRGARIDLVHDSVAKTVEILRSLPTLVRDSIRGLGIRYEAENPPDYMSFHVLCGILTTMKALRMLTITIPTHVDYPRPPVPPGQGLCQRLRDDLVWRMEFLVIRQRYGWETKSECNWRTAPTTPWVLDLLSVTAAGLFDFELRASPSASGKRLAHFLNMHMLEGPATRRQLIEQLKRQLEEQGRRHALWWELLTILWRLLFEEMAIIWVSWLVFVP